jgi:hypothetical protein
MDDRIVIEANDSLLTPQDLLGDLWDRVPKARRSAITLRILAARAAERALIARLATRGRRG